MGEELHFRAKPVFRHEFDFNSALEVEFQSWKRVTGHSSETSSSDEEREESKGSKRVRSPSIFGNKFMRLRKSTSSSSKQERAKDMVGSTESRAAQPNHGGGGDGGIATDATVGHGTDEKTRKKSLLPKWDFNTFTTVALLPLKTQQFVRPTRRTLMLDGHPEKCECTITDNDDGEIQFSCVLSRDGIVCRNYRTMLDIVSVGCLQHLDSEDDPVGIYYTIEGYRDGQIARIKKGNTFSRVKYHLNLVTESDHRMLLALPNSSQSRTAPLPLLKQSLVVHREWGNILKIRTKSGNLPIATIQKEMSSMRYWLHLEPHADSCFVSAIASYLLRRKIFGDRLPKVLKTSSTLSKRARRLSLSFRRKKKHSPVVAKTSTASA